METQSAPLRPPSSSYPLSHGATSVAEIRAAAPGEVRVIRRNGKVTGFDGSKINVAITKAFLAVEGSQAAASRRIHEIVAELSGQVISALFRRLPSGGTIHIEDIQDQVELALMRSEHQKERAPMYFIAKSMRACAPIRPATPKPPHRRRYCKSKQPTARRLR